MKNPGKFEPRHTPIWELSILFHLSLCLVLLPMFHVKRASPPPPQNSPRLTPQKSLPINRQKGGQRLVQKSASDLDSSDWKKLQAPSSKLQKNFKPQIPSSTTSVSRRVEWSATLSSEHELLLT